MVSIANQIEQHIKELLDASVDGVLEFRRNDLAANFMCVPSQINYVLETRFCAGSGYHVETRRGGSGYVKIIKLGMDNDADLQQLLQSATDHAVSQIAGERLLSRLVDEDFLTPREGKIMLALLDNANLQFDTATADLLRARLLNTLLVSLLREDI